jgi:hypothetical protein
MDRALDRDGVVFGDDKGLEECKDGGKEAVG